MLLMAFGVSEVVSEPETERSVPEPGPPPGSTIVDTGSLIGPGPSISRGSDMPETERPVVVGIEGGLTLLCLLIYLRRLDTVDCLPF